MNQHTIIRRMGSFVSIHLPLWKRGSEGNLSNKIPPNPSFSKRGTE